MSRHRALSIRMSYPANVWSTTRTTQPNHAGTRPAWHTARPNKNGRKRQMISPAIAHILLPSIVGISILLMLVRPNGIPEVYWIGGGAVLLVLLRLVPLRLAGRVVAEGSDVYLFLIGMMLSELAREHRVFDWLSSAAGRMAPPARLYLRLRNRHGRHDTLCRTTRPPSCSRLPF